jgi:hypothetical protein
MMEINVNLSTQNLFRMAKVAAVMEIRARALEKVGEVVANVLYNIVSMLVGLQGGHFGALGQAITKATQLGAMFENFLVGIFCFAFEDIAGDMIWLEPGIRQRDGNPRSNGYSCNERPGSRGKTIAGVRHPDFVFRDRPPTANKQSRKSYTIGEIKIGINTFYSTWKRKRPGQWQAVYMYAQRHTYPPRLVLLMAFNSGKKYQWKWLSQEIASKRVAGVIISAR